MTNFHSPATKNLQVGSAADIAFLLVVLAAYLAMFSSLPEISIFQLVVMNLLGISYLLMGIYGYSVVQRSQKLPVKVIYFVIQFIVGGAIILIGRGPFSNLSLNSLLLLPLAVQSVVLLPAIWMVSANVLLFTVYLVTSFQMPFDFDLIVNTVPLFFVGQIFIVFFTQMAVTEDRSRKEIGRLISELEEANQHLREYALQVEELAVTQERNRMAREIHDGLGHYLTSIYMQAQAARATMDKDPVVAQGAMLKAQNLAQDALNDVRQSVSTLRSPIIENHPISTVINRLIEKSGTEGMTVSLHVLGDERLLHPQINWALYRAVQEAVNNAKKYSQATHMTIQLDFRGPTIIVMHIDDNGIGTENPEGGFGLIGIEERMKLLNGYCEVATAVGQGFHIKIGVPG